MMFGKLLNLYAYIYDSNLKARSHYHSLISLVNQWKNLFNLGIWVNIGCLVTNFGEGLDINYQIICMK